MYDWKGPDFGHFVPLRVNYLALVNYLLIELVQLAQVFLTYLPCVNYQVYIVDRAVRVVCDDFELMKAKEVVGINFTDEEVEFLGQAKLARIATASRIEPAACRARGLRVRWDAFLFRRLESGQEPKVSQYPEQWQGCLGDR